MKRSFPDDLVIGNLSRRGFLKGVGATGVLLVAANWGWRDALAAEKKAFGADAMPHGWVDNPKIYVSIDRDGTVGIVCNRSEMGQGVRTSLAMVVADELEADWSRVKVIQAPGDEARYGNQDTDGSRSMRHWFEPMRRCGAAARQMLEQAAANQWKVPLGECRAEQNKVLHAPSGRSLSFGELAEADLLNEQRPWLEVRVMLDQPQPDLRQQVESALLGKACRLVRIASEYQRRDEEQAPLLGLDQLNPQELFSRAWESAYGSGPDAQALDDFASLLQSVELATEEPPGK